MENKTPNTISVDLTAEEIITITLMAKLSMIFMLLDHAPSPVIDDFKDKTTPLLQKLLEKSEIKAKEETFDDMVKDLNIKFKPDEPK